MKVASILLVVLALVIGILPQFTDCESQGGMLTLQNGKTVSMKCHWTARSEIAVAAPLFAVGSVLTFSKRKETRRALGVLGILLGVFAILLPTALIGVCANPEMICNSTMKPALLFTGALSILVGMYVTFAPTRGVESA